MKNDFINNITHEFKTPISTIALAAEVLTKSGPRSLPSRVKRYSKIISDENEFDEMKPIRLTMKSMHNAHGCFPCFMGKRKRNRGSVPA
jgi:signal transduction histidine kinase